MPCILAGGSIPVRIEYPECRFSLVAEAHFGPLVKAPIDTGAGEKAWVVAGAAS
jgi:hypothetical protein